MIRKKSFGFRLWFLLILFFCLIYFLFEIAFTVTLQLWFVFVLAKDSSNIVFVQLVACIEK
ncbi:hypothetical protein GZH53_02410 [Flavihumibacter sp. R14]|nr:hypothetical protein [Flavihumibacter soli]